MIYDHFADLPFFLTLHYSSKVISSIKFGLQTRDHYARAQRDIRLSTWPLRHEQWICFVKSIETVSANQGFCDI